MDRIEAAVLRSRKLVILRGNSGSGKTTVARMLRESSPRMVAVVEQDYIRRKLLKEKDATGSGNVGDLIRQIVGFALDRGYDVVVEGILPFERYGAFLQELVEQVDDHHVCYFDVSFAETLRRHATRPQAREFDEAAMRGWYQAGDVTGLPGERIIPEHYSLERTVRTIRAETGL